jgi:hypothetical protein
MGGRIEVGKHADAGACGKAFAGPQPGGRQRPAAFGPP